MIAEQLTIGLYGRGENNSVQRSCVSRGRDHRISQQSEVYNFMLVFKWMLSLKIRKM